MGVLSVAACTISSWALLGTQHVLSAGLHAYGSVAATVSSALSNHDACACLLPCFLAAYSTFSYAYRPAVLGRDHTHRCVSCGILS